ncbi:MAG: WecB/TagA/CpsF family glycosyltransferase [Dehalococcoidia bacterium]
MTTSAYGPHASSLQPANDSRLHVEIDGIPVFAGSAEQAVRRCVELVELSLGGRVATANLDFFALARRNAQLRSDLKDSTLVVADGMPVVWMGRMAGARGIQRLAGVDLVRELFVDRDSGSTFRVAIYGSTEAITSRAIDALHDAGNGARVVHVANPPFRALSEAEIEADRAELVAARPDIVLVALGCPGQERLIAEWHPHLPKALWIGIGGTLDFYAGVRKRAPKAAQRFGFEWVVRMAQEPRRLGKRYLLRDLPALARIAPGCIRFRLTNAKSFE